jgi:mediator of RNA polymerase II transcription subunit 12, fungi type
MNTATNDIAQNRGGGATQSVTNTARPTVPNLSLANLRQVPAVIDLTTDGQGPNTEPIQPRIRGPKSVATGGTENNNPTTQGRVSPDGVAQGKFQSKGRPSRYFDAATPDLAGIQTSASQKSPASESVAIQLRSVVPLPPRPISHIRGEHIHYDMVTARDGRADGVGEELFRIPAGANCFGKGKPVDFFMWSGNHPEDALNEALVKTGFSNKPNIMNETNTAGPSLRSHLKNKQGLSTLSGFFVTMLERQQAAGKLTTTSTFKPPPRVTLTSSKREAWLRDLAVPTVPLRRLSRTIPHGIQGKVLLEQCLKNKVPTSRAVWFAKCVGANEMRAFKRKGAASAIGLGSEAKWVREWTGFVEQFLEATIALCGQPGWNEDMDYSYVSILHQELSPQYPFR